jgi:hypothetical protein
MSALTSSGRESPSRQGLSTGHRGNGFIQPKPVLRVRPKNRIRRQRIRPFIDIPAFLVFQRRIPTTGTRRYGQEKQLNHRCTQIHADHSEQETLGSVCSIRVNQYASLVLFLFFSSPCLRVSVVYPLLVAARAALREYPQNRPGWGILNGTALGNSERDGSGGILNGTALNYQLVWHLIQSCPL